MISWMFQSLLILLYNRRVRVRVMVFKVTFNNISVISWQSVLMVKETGENHQPASSHWQTLSHNVVSSTPHLSGIQTHNVSGDRHTYVWNKLNSKKWITCVVLSNIKNVLRLKCFWISVQHILVIFFSLVIECVSRYEISPKFY